MLQEGVHLALLGAAIVAALMFALWIVHLLIRNAAIADAGWAACLATLAIFYAATGPGYSARKWAMACMAGFWGLRLASYLLFARVIGKPEEGRYVQLRKEWRTHLALHFLFYFEFQSLLAALNTSAPLNGVEKFGAGIWLVAMIGEAIADYQLYRFKKSPTNRGKTFRGGLWRYSRHPNYFFEWLIWVGYAVFAMGSPWGWLGLICPILVMYFLLGATGIAATEAQALRTRGHEYRAYQRSTSAFIPWFRKKRQA